MFDAFFSFEGRLGRIRYWTRGPQIAIVLLAVFFLLLFLDTFVRISWPFFVLVPLMIVLYVWSVLSIAVRRLHDRGKSGWWMLLYGPVQIMVSVPNDRHGMHGALRAIDWIHIACLLIAIWIFIDLGLLGPKRPRKPKQDIPAVPV